MVTEIHALVSVLTGMEKFIPATTGKTKEQDDLEQVKKRLAF